MTVRQKFITKIDKVEYKKKKYTAQFKVKVAFEAAKEDRNITEIAFKSFRGNIWLEMCERSRTVTKTLSYIKE